VLEVLSAPKRPELGVVLRRGKRPPRSEAALWNGAGRSPRWPPPINAPPYPFFATFGGGLTWRGCRWLGGHRGAGPCASCYWRPPVWVPACNTQAPFSVERLQRSGRRRCWYRLSPRTARASRHQLTPSSAGSPTAPVASAWRLSGGAGSGLSWRRPARMATGTRALELDIAAGVACSLSRAGGVVSRYDGSPFAAQRRRLIASASRASPTPDGWTGPNCRPLPGRLLRHPGPEAEA